MTATRALGVTALAATFAAGCELTEVTIAEPGDVVVVEGWVMVTDTLFGEAARVFLHRTLDASSDVRPVPGARVWVELPERNPERVLPLGESDPGRCVINTPEVEAGTCYTFEGEGVGIFLPGELARLVVELPDGGRIVGATRLPGDFGLLGVPDAGGCTLPADTTFELRWTRSEGAWAYVIEAAIHNLPAALLSYGIDYDVEELNLLGLSVAASDTTFVFPSELGVFARADLDRDVALVLQEGLPSRASARVTVAAVERNWVNWLRGGNFNPSGQVRVPSVTGDGTGWFGSAVVRVLDVATPGSEAGVPEEAPECGTVGVAAPRP